MSETADTFTCDSCGETFDKTWSDEEAAAEAQELFPGIDASDPEEAGTVCDDCFNHIMGRVREEAPELIGEGWRGDGIIGYDAVPMRWPEPVYTPMRNRFSGRPGSAR